jgi:hypothetical protein
METPVNEELEKPIEENETLNAAVAESDEQSEVSYTCIVIPLEELVEQENPETEEIEVLLEPSSVQVQEQLQIEEPPAQPRQLQPPIQAQTLPRAQEQPQPPAQVQTQPQIQPREEQPRQELIQQAPDTTEEITAAESVRIESEERSLQNIVPSFRRDIFPSAPAARPELFFPQNENIIFSRVAHVTVGQILEIPFRGNGWVYLGELTSKRGIVYNSRRNDAEGISFIFNIEETGTFTLKFFREDFTRGYILNDYVQVIASEAPAAVSRFNLEGEGSPLARSRVVAQPRWPSAIEEAEIRSSIGSAGTGSPRNPPVTTVFTPGTVPSSLGAAAAQNDTAPTQETAPTQRTAPAQETTATQRTTPAQTAPIQRAAPTAPTQEAAAAQRAAPTATTQEAAAAQRAAPAAPTQEAAAQQENVIERVSPDMLLQRAKETFDAGNTAEAIALLDQYMRHFPGGSDEAYWLYAQFYEANTPSRNILLSLDYYRRLVREYPQSSRLTDARRRIAYLERFYININ